MICIGRERDVNLKILSKMLCELCLDDISGSIGTEKNRLLIDKDSVCCTVLVDLSNQSFPAGQTTRLCGWRRWIRWRRTWPASVSPTRSCPIPSSTTSCIFSGRPMRLESTSCTSTFLTDQYSCSPRLFLHRPAALSAICLSWLGRIWNLGEGGLLCTKQASHHSKFCMTTDRSREHTVQTGLLCTQWTTFTEILKSTYISSSSLGLSSLWL